jgi:[histone H3]-dimethyl-L-lysine9 demethylase
MYNAFAMDDVPGASGSTRLHMDIADAVNVMVHSELTPKGDPGFATWDLFRAEDAGKIREFLFEEFPLHSESPHLDPIHSQHYYLDSVLLDKLRSSKGVKSFRIEQHPGEAVFIPAGCPHQVNSQTHFLLLNIS